MGALFTLIPRFFPGRNFQKKRLKTEWLQKSVHVVLQIFQFKTNREINPFIIILVRDILQISIPSFGIFCLQNEIN